MMTDYKGKKLTQIVREICDRIEEPLLKDAREDLAVALYLIAEAATGKLTLNREALIECLELDRATVEGNVELRRYFKVQKIMAEALEGVE